MNKVAVIYNPHMPESERLARELDGWLRARAIDVWRGVSAEAREPHALDFVDLIVALGGDGTVLRAAHLAIRCGVPVLPVALGRLNFMAELLPENLYQGMETLLGGGGWRDERTLVEATIYHDHDGGERPDHALALNEMLVARGDINRTVLVDVEIYDAQLTTYHADGVIVATATGSTAYALAAGGPIVDPRSRALVLVALAAHLTNIPSLVLHEDAVVTLTLRSRHPAAFSADGREHIALHEGDVVVVRRSPQTCTFARVYPQSTFYSRMTRRLRRD
ncbi:MAG TPA: NAD(+)/NADH kinase [Roseiflexaceae bacterium]|nr:NAD(+)/NADH kinase [Roseiflexaceae bacterium]